METPVVIEEETGGTFAWGSKNLQYYGGKFYFVYRSRIGEDTDVYLKTSEDGITWSQRIEVSDGPVSTTQTTPKMVIGGDPNSPDICVAWDDRRAAQSQVHVAVSTNGGQTLE